MLEAELIPHLFRTEYRKIVAVLCKAFGLENLETAEDVVADTFLLAAETWGLKGLPQNPTAWLYTVAKNKAKDVFKRQNIFKEKVVPELSQSTVFKEEIEIDLSAKNIEDSQLKMMFAVCQPGISIEAQIGLSLNILCGFGIDEIADAFLSNRETIYKRLSRAKEKLSKDRIKLELPAESIIQQRLNTVLKTIYLLFSEGYYSSSKTTPLRQELCVEAMRLNLMLVENESTNSAAANALLALMCFHASRFEARTAENGDVVLYEDQNSELWNSELIARGEYYLNRASTGKDITHYHIEAAIAFWHTQKVDSQEKWESILQLYTKLLEMEYSPLAA
jgi:RNA polymerase sigma factor (sigma-70 family)